MFYNNFIKGLNEKYRYQLVKRLEFLEKFNIYHQSDEVYFAEQLLKFLDNNFNNEDEFQSFKDTLNMTNAELQLNAVKIILDSILELDNLIKEQYFNPVF